MSLQVIKEYLSYDSSTGVFLCIKRYCNKVHVGSEVGSITNGYREFRFMGIRYLAHRLAWWWVHGQMPKRIDHRNGRRDENRISNLRPCTHSCNIANAGRRKPEGYKGVYFNRRTGRWQAKIKCNYRPVHLGVFDDEEEAAQGYDAAAIKLFGEFARPNFPVQLS